MIIHTEQFIYQTSWLSDCWAQVDLGAVFAGPFASPSINLIFSSALTLWPSQHFLLTFASHLYLILWITRLLSWFVTRLLSTPTSPRSHKTVNSGKQRQHYVFKITISRNFVGYRKQQARLGSFCLACFLKLPWWILCALIRQSVPDHGYYF